MLPVLISLDSAIFTPGPHTITIVANSTAGDVATFSSDFSVVGNNRNLVLKFIFMAL